MTFILRQCFDFAKFHLEQIKNVFCNLVLMLLTNFIKLYQQYIFSHKMYSFTKLKKDPYSLWILQVCEIVCLIVSFCVNITRISRLFIDAKKILLYTQNDKSYEGYKGLLRALRKLQKNTARKNIPLIICLFMWFITFLHDQLIDQFSHQPNWLFKQNKKSCCAHADMF